MYTLKGRRKGMVRKEARLQAFNGSTLGNVINRVPACYSHTLIVILNFARERERERDRLTRQLPSN